MKPFFQIRLEEELKKRRGKNKSYSLRAFALDLEVNAGFLSRVIRGAQTPALDASKRLIKKLKLSSEESQLFLESIASAQGNKKFELKPKASDSVDKDYVQLSEEQFQLVANPLHFAILEATYLDGVELSAKSLSKKLGTPAIEVQYAIDRLKRLGLLAIEGEKYKKTHTNIKFLSETSVSKAQLEHQATIAGMSQKAIRRIPFEKRAHNALTLPFDPKKLPLARKMIQEFMADFCKAMFTENKTDVYQMQVGLFPFSLED